MLIIVFCNDRPTTEVYTISQHTALPIPARPPAQRARSGYPRANARASAECAARREARPAAVRGRSEEHTSELQSRQYLVCRLLLEKKEKRRVPYTEDISTISYITIPTYH